MSAAGDHRPAFSSGAQYARSVGRAPVDAEVRRAGHRKVDQGRCPRRAGGRRRGMHFDRFDGPSFDRAKDMPGTQRPVHDGGHLFEVEITQDGRHLEQEPHHFGLQELMPLHNALQAVAFDEAPHDPLGTHRAVAALELIEDEGQGRMVQSGEGRQIGVQLLERFFDARSMKDVLLHHDAESVRAPHAEIGDGALGVRPAGLMAPGAHDLIESVLIRK